MVYHLLVINQTTCHHVT